MALVVVVGTSCRLDRFKQDQESIANNLTPSSRSGSTRVNRLARLGPASQRMFDAHSLGYSLAACLLLFATILEPNNSNKEKRPATLFADCARTNLQPSQAASAAAAANHGGLQQQQLIGEGQDATGGSAEYLPSASLMSDGGGSRQWYFAGGASGAPSATNSKRARKMSAFMPMRGRRAGQWEAWSSSREPDNDDSTAALGPSDNNIGQLSALLDAEAGRPVTTTLFVLPALPARFALQHQLMMQRRSLNQQAARFAAAEAESGVEQQQQQQQQQQQPAATANAGAGLIGPKPRRAFYPMRGKKSLRLDMIPEQQQQQQQADQLVDLLAGHAGDWTATETGVEEKSRSPYE